MTQHESKAQVNASADGIRLPRTDLRAHFLFILIASAVPVVIGILEELTVLQVLILLYAEFVVANFFNVLRIRLHRKTSRKRGHFIAHEMEDGGYRAEGFRFRATFGGWAGWSVLYATVLAAVVHFENREVFYDGIVIDMLICAAIPTVEFLLNLPGISKRRFAWLEQHARDTGGQHLALAFALPVAMLASGTAGIVLIGLVNGLIEFLWSSVFLVIKDRRKYFPGISYDPQFQQEWRRDLAKWSKMVDRNDLILDQGDWHRMMREANGDYSHVQHPSANTAVKPRFASANAPATEMASDSSDLAVQFGVQVKPDPAGMDVLVMQHNGESCGEAKKVRRAYEISVEDALFTVATPSPMNGLSWQLQSAGKTVATAHRERTLGFLSRAGFRVVVGEVQYYWGSRYRESSEWILYTIPDETAHARTKNVPLSDFPDQLMATDQLKPHLAMFLMILYSHWRHQRSVRNDEQRAG